MGRNDALLASAVAPHAACVLANLIFGIGNIVSKVGLRSMNPFLFALLREAIAGPTLFFASCLMERQCGSRKISATEPGCLVLRRFLLCGFALYAANACNIVGVKLAGASLGAIWASALPLMITIVAVLAGFETCTVHKAIGVVVATAGCVFVSTDGFAARDPGSEHSHVGNFLFFVGVVSTSTFYVSQKPLLRRYPPLMVLAYSYGIAVVPMTCTCTAFTANRWLLDLVCADCGGEGWTVPVDSRIAIAYWVFLCSVLASFLNTWGNTRVHTSIVGIYGSVQPIVTILVSELIIQNTPPPHYHLVGVTWADTGAVAVFGGLVLVVCDNCRGHGQIKTVPSDLE